MKLPHQKQMQQLKNKLGEIKARQRSLETADKVDMKAVNANIDDMTKVQNQMMKAKAAHRNEVRNLLNDEQRLWFDKQGGKSGTHFKGAPNGERPMPQRGGRR